jgi:hypothetical protein
VGILLMQIVKKSAVSTAQVSDLINLVEIK